MNQNDPVKQVIIIRTLFPNASKQGESRSVRIGKMISQGAHASLKVFTDRMVHLHKQTVMHHEMNGWDWEAVDEWLEGSFTKIVLQVESGDELNRLYNEGISAGIPCALIEDSGKTEFGGSKTLTALALGPARSSRIDPITRDLKLF